MTGQWTTDYVGTNTGRATINIDDAGSYYDIEAYAWDANKQLPSSYVRFQTIGKSMPQTFHGARVILISSETGTPLTDDEIASLRKVSTTLPAFADITIEFSDDKLLASWKTDIGTAGQATAARPKPRPVRRPIDGISTWEKFKQYVDDLPRRQFAFRGQKDNAWRLRTSFHRTGRANVNRFRAIDLPRLDQELIDLLPRRFNLSDDNELASFVGFAQHHGYPTPLLDWSESPYVAAFFAYKDIQKSQLDDLTSKVRIYVFNTGLWISKVPQLARFGPNSEQVSVLKPEATMNQRLRPQQGLSIFTNIDDIETHIEKIENIHGETFLDCIDLPVSERNKVMADLLYMNINAATLFPGHEGVCSKVMEDNFF